jgi:hypothetical protein
MDSQRDLVVGNRGCFSRSADDGSHRAFGLVNFGPATRSPPRRNFRSRRNYTFSLSPLSRPFGPFIDRPSGQQRVGSTRSVGRAQWPVFAHSGRLESTDIVL